MPTLDAIPSTPSVVTDVMTPAKLQVLGKPISALATPALPKSSGFSAFRSFPASSKNNNNNNNASSVVPTSSMTAATMMYGAAASPGVPSPGDTVVSGMSTPPLTYGTTSNVHSTPPADTSRRVSPSLFSAHSRAPSDMPPLQLAAPTSRGGSIVASRRTSTHLGILAGESGGLDGVDLPSITASMAASNEEAPAALVAAMGRLTESWWAKAPVRRSSHLPSSSGYLAVVGPRSTPQTPQPSNSKATLNSALQTIEKELQGSFSSDFLIRDVPNGSEGCESDWRLLAQICVEIPVIWTSLIKPLSPESTYIEALLKGTYVEPSPSLLPPPLLSHNSSVLTPKDDNANTTTSASSNKATATTSKTRTVVPPTTYYSSSPHNGPHHHHHQLSDNILLSSWVVVADGWKAGKAFLKRFQSRDVQAPYNRNIVPQSPLSPNDCDPDYIPPYVTQLRYLAKLPQTIVEGIYLVAEVLRSLVVQPNVGGCMAALAALHHLLLHHMLFTQKLAGELGLGPKVPSPQYASTSPPMTNIPNAAADTHVWRDRLTRCNFIVVLEKLYVGLSLRFQLFFGMALGRPLLGRGEAKPPPAATAVGAATPSVMDESTNSQNQQHLVSLDMCLGTVPTVPTTEREKAQFHLTAQHGRALSTRFGALLIDENAKDDSIVVNHDPHQQQQQHQQQQRMLLDAPPAFPSLLKPAGGGNSGGGGVGGFLMGNSSTTSLLHPPSDGGGGGPSFGSFPDTGLLGSATTPRDMSQLSASSSYFRHYSNMSGRRSDLSIVVPGGGSNSGGGVAGSGSSLPEQIHVVPHIASTPLGLSLVAIRQALRKSNFLEINIALVVDVRHMMGFNSEAKFGKPHIPQGHSADDQQQAGATQQQQQQQHPPSSSSNRRRHCMCWKDNAFTVSSSIDGDSHNHDTWLHDRIPSYHRQQQHAQSSQPSSAEEEGSGSTIVGGSNGEPTIDILDVIQEGQQATSSDNFVGCALSPPTMTTECMKHLVVVAALKGPELRGQDHIAPNYAMFRGKDTVVFVTTAPSSVIDSGPFYLAISASVPDTTSSSPSGGGAFGSDGDDGSTISGNSSAISTKSKGISGLFNRMFNTNKKRTESVIVPDGTESHMSKATFRQTSLESRSDGELDRMFTSTILTHCNNFHAQLLMVPQSQIIRFDQSE